MFSARATDEISRCIHRDAKRCVRCGNPPTKSGISVTDDQFIVIALCDDCFNELKYGNTKVRLQFITIPAKESPLTSGVG